MQEFFLRFATSSGFQLQKTSQQGCSQLVSLLISPSRQPPPGAARTQGSPHPGQPAPRAAHTQPAMEPPEQGRPCSPSSPWRLLPSPQFMKSGRQDPLISVVPQCLKLLFYLLHLISSCGEVLGEGNMGVQAVGASRHPDFSRQAVYARCPGVTINNVLFRCWGDKLYAHSVTGA